MAELREAETTTISGPVVVSRSYQASPERVFEAWLDREQMGHFLFATPGGAMQRVEVDPRVGGRFRIDEQRENGLACHYGEYAAIDRPRRLVFQFKTDPAQSPTEVTITIEPADGGSQLNLSHTGVWESLRSRTRDGWTQILDALASVVERG